MSSPWLETTQVTSDEEEEGRSSCGQRPQEKEKDRMGQTRSSSGSQQLTVPTIEQMCPRTADAFRVGWMIKRNLNTLSKIRKSNCNNVRRWTCTDSTTRFRYDSSNTFEFSKWKFLEISLATRTKKINTFADMTYHNSWFLFNMIYFYKAKETILIFIIYVASSPPHGHKWIYTHNVMIYNAL